MPAATARRGLPLGRRDEAKAHFAPTPLRRAALGAQLLPLSMCIWKPSRVHGCGRTRGAKAKCVGLSSRRKSTNLSAHVFVALMRAWVRVACDLFGLLASFESFSPGCGFQTFVAGAMRAPKFGLSESLGVASKLLRAMTPREPFTNPNCPSKIYFGRLVAAIIYTYIYVYI